MSRIYLFISLVFLFMGSFTQDIQGSATVPFPVVEDELEFRNHKIQDIFLSYNNETVLLLDEGSSWIVKDNLDAEERESLIGISVSFMPTAGENNSDRFVVHRKRDTSILDVENLNYSRYGCHRIAEINGNALTIYLDNKGLTKTYNLSEESIETALLWSEGDPILIGGIWFDGLDSQQREVPACTSFTLYNYRYQEFVFSHLP